MNQSAIDVHAHFAPAIRFEELRAFSPGTTPGVDVDGNAFLGSR